MSEIKRTLVPTPVSEAPLPETEKKPEGDGKVHIHYQKAKTYKRIFARLVDLLLMVLFGMLFYLGIRAIVMNTSSYKEASERTNETMKDSGLYVESDGVYRDIVTYYKNQDLSASGRMKTYESSLDTFIQFIYSDGIEGAGDEVKANYDSYRLDATYNDQHFFVKNDQGEIIKNSSFKGDDIYSLYSSNVYEPYIDTQARGFLLSKIPQYYSDTKMMSNVVIFLEVPLAVLFAALLVLMVPPLCFKRNRQTIGMLVYHIGLINNDLLAVKTGKCLIWSFLRSVLVILLSFYTLGIPLIIDITMLVATKTKQDFTEYMLQVYEVDVTNSKIYYSHADIENDYLLVDQKGVDFKNIESK